MQPYPFYAQSLQCKPFTQSSPGNRQSHTEAPPRSPTGQWFLYDLTAPTAFHLDTGVCEPMWKVPANWRYGAKTKSLFCPKGLTLKSLHLLGRKKSVAHFKLSADIFMRKTNHLRLANLQWPRETNRPLSSPGLRNWTGHCLPLSPLYPEGAYNILLFIYLFGVTWRVSAVCWCHVVLLSVRAKQLLCLSCMEGC